jgi:hypothetical protein
MPSQAVQTHAQGSEKAEGLYGSRHARPTTPSARQPRRRPTGPDHRQARLVSQLLHQQSKGGDKKYALHEPDVDCICKGKARVRYEFGCNISIATTLNEGFVVGMRSLAANHYDGHTLKKPSNRWRS